MPGTLAVRKAWGNGARTRPIMLAIAGDSAAGKSTLARGLVEALGPERITAICVDDYHCYDREERRSLAFTPLHPACNYVQIMEQHLQLLALGRPVLKPVYDHRTGSLSRPRLVEPAEFVIAEGLLPLHTRLARACFDATVYLDPPEEIRIGWKISRDTGQRGYDAAQVREELARREPEAAAFIRPQRTHADIVVSFSPIESRGEALDDPLSATVLLRPTIAHPDLSAVLSDDTRQALHLKLIRDDDGKPVDALHIHAYAEAALTDRVARAIWGEIGAGEPLPETLGRLEAGTRSSALALVQLILLFHLIQARRPEGQYANEGAASGRSLVR